MTEEYWKSRLPVSGMSGKGNRMSNQKKHVKKWDLFFHCGAIIKNCITKFPFDKKEKLCVYDNFRGGKRPRNEDGGQPQCCNCPCKRASKSKKEMYFTDDDKKLHRRPNGVYVTCVPDKNVEILDFSE